MVGINDLENTVRRLLREVEAGEKDPLAIKLVESYRNLRGVDAGVDRRIDVDGTLNTLLENKTTRIQELARILASPEVYVNRIRGMKPMSIAKLISYRQPMTISHLNVSGMHKSFSRILGMMESREKSMLEEENPPSTAQPQNEVMEIEDSITLEDLNRFLKYVPENQAISLKELLASPNMDEFLRRFLCVVLLISRGLLKYDGENVKRTEMRTDE